MMRIVIIGSGGQVGAEVALLLSALPSLELVPVVRSRMGSAFLRQQGIRVAHGSITDASFARSVLQGADLVVSFALAGGTPRQALAQNGEIIRSIFEYSSKTATVVFFSTLAVHGFYDAEGRRRPTAYGDVKLANERLVASLSRQRGQPGYVLRLGHVAGEHQELTRQCRDEISSPPVAVMDPDRVSNVTHTATIAEAILAIAEGRTGPAGRYDLVNVPQWSWREVYDKEARKLGLPLQMIALQSGPRRRPFLVSRLGRSTLSRFATRNMKDRVLRVLKDLPTSINDYITAEYYVSRARAEIAALERSPEIRNPATLWPALETDPLPGLRATRELLDMRTFAAERRQGAQWPADLGPALAEPMISSAR